MYRKSESLVAKFLTQIESIYMSDKFIWIFCMCIHFSFPNIHHPSIIVPRERRRLCGWKVASRQDVCQLLKRLSANNAFPLFLFLLHTFYVNLLQDVWRMRVGVLFFFGSHLETERVWSCLMRCSMVFIAFQPSSLVIHLTKW